MEIVPLAVTDVIAISPIGVVSGNTGLRIVIYSDTQIKRVGTIDNRASNMISNCDLINYAI